MLRERSVTPGGIRRPSVQDLGNSVSCTLLTCFAFFNLLDALVWFITANYGHVPSATLFHSERTTDSRCITYAVCTVRIYNDSGYI